MVKRELITHENRCVLARREEVFPVTWKDTAGEAVPTSQSQGWCDFGARLCAYPVCGQSPACPSRKGVGRELASLEGTVDLKACHPDSSLNCVTDSLCDLSGLVALSENERSVSPGCEM